MTVKSSIGVSNPGQGMDAGAAVRPEPVYQSPQPSGELTDLESLIFLGRVERTVDVNGKKIKMHTLTNEEQKVSISLISKNRPDGSLIDTLELRDAILALAIDDINGMPLESLYIGDGESSLDSRLKVIGAWQPFLSEFLYEEYQKLVTDSRKAIFGEESQGSNLDLEKGKETIKN